MLPRFVRTEKSAEIRLLHLSFCHDIESDVLSFSILTSLRPSIILRVK
jgi:hypothetical protein